MITTCNIAKGETFTEANLDIKRPGTGIAPKYYEQILGKRAAADLGADTLLGWTDIMGMTGEDI